jgi:hypothetical protein
MHNTALPIPILSFDATTPGLNVFYNIQKLFGHGNSTMTGNLYTDPQCSESKDSKHAGTLKNKKKQEGHPEEE